MCQRCSKQYASTLPPPPRMRSRRQDPYWPTPTMPKNNSGKLNKKLKHCIVNTLKLSWMKPWHLTNEKNPRRLLTLFEWNETNGATLHFASTPNQNWVEDLHLLIPWQGQTTHPPQLSIKKPLMICYWSIATTTLRKPMGLHSQPSPSADYYNMMDSPLSDSTCLKEWWTSTLQHLMNQLGHSLHTCAAIPPQQSPAPIQLIMNCS